MKSESVVVSKRGYIVLPAHLRKEMNIKPGTRVMLIRENDRIILETMPSFTQKLSGLTRQTIGTTPEAVDTFIDKEREDRSYD